MSFYKYAALGTVAAIAILAISYRHPGDHPGGGDMTPEEVLLKAAEVMSERGKAKGMYQDPMTREVCAYGAMTLAATDGKKYDVSDTYSQGVTYHLIHQAAGLLAESIRAQSNMFDDDFTTVTLYNDNDNTTAEDMILAMKRAATA